MTSTPDARARSGFAGIQALQSREPGYAVARECLAVQAAAEARDPSLRTERGVRLHPDAWSWYVGALGEIEVGQILAQLGLEWMVRHAVPIGAGATDVDHLLVGPTGVFALNTKRHLDANIWVGDHVLRVNNQNTRHLAAARHEATEVARRLSAKVGFAVVPHSVIVAVGASRIRDVRKPIDRPTTVVFPRELLSWITNRTTSLSTAALELVALAAEEPDTWHVDPRAAETLRVMPRFQRLRAEVGDRPPAPGSAAPSLRPAPGSAAPSSRPSRPTRYSRPARPTAAPSRRTPSGGRPARSKVLVAPTRAAQADRWAKALLIGVVIVPMTMVLGGLLLSIISSAL